MAEQQQAASISAAFPAPPPFYKHFTEENLQRVKELREAHPAESIQPAGSSELSSSLDPLQLLNLPPELRCLVPPAPPASGKFRSFGINHEINAPIPSLESQSFPQLYPSPPTPHHLLLITRSILLNFLEFVHILATDPSEYPQKWDDLRDLFMNAHQLINEYRPHQARESLILMMEDQVERCREEIRGVKETKEKVDAVLKELGEELGGVVEGRNKPKAAEKRDKKRAIEARIWDMIEQEVGI